MSVPSLKKIAEELAAQLGYRVDDFCGNGAFKETYRVVNGMGERAALKVLDPRKIDRQRTDREIDALRRCDVAGIAKLLDSLRLKAGDGSEYEVVLEEYLDGGTVAERHKSHPYSSQRVGVLAKGIADSLAELVRHKLVHRDIKPANVMFRGTDDAPVLVDFGLVRDLSQTSLTGSHHMRGPGTPLYASPEQLNNEKSLIDWRSDQFSLAIMCGELLTGRHPYQNASMTQAEAVAAVERMLPLAPEFVSFAEGSGWEPLLKMLRPYPVERYATPDKLLAALNNIA